RFFWNATLAGATSEEKFFRKIRGEAIDMVGPWPAEALTTEDLPVALAEHLWRSRGRYGRKMRWDQVQHFACHCDSADSSLESRMGFRDAQSVTIGELKAHLRGLAGQSKPRVLAMPI